MYKSFFLAAIQGFCARNGPYWTVMPPKQIVEMAEEVAKEATHRWQQAGTVNDIGHLPEGDI